MWFLSLQSTLENLMIMSQRFMWTGVPGPWSSKMFLRSLFLHASRNGIRRVWNWWHALPMWESFSSSFSWWVGLCYRESSGSCPRARTGPSCPLPPEKLSAVPVGAKSSRLVGAPTTAAPPGPYSSCSSNSALSSSIEITITCSYSLWLQPLAQVGWSWAVMIAHPAWD